MTHTPTKMPGQEAREFFELLGRCIAAWANVDDELFRIFRECFGRHYKQSAIVFYRIDSLALRLALTTEIVFSILPERPKRSGSHDLPSAKAWDKLRTEFDGLLAIRRRLAHHPVGGAPFLDLAVDVGEHEKIRKKSAGFRPLKRSDLIAHLSRVRKLANGLNDYSRNFLTPLLEESFRTIHEQDSHP